MARITTALGIANLAASLLKIDAVTSIDPPDRQSKAAKQFSQWYDTCRREVLSEAIWDCALERVQLAAATPAPTFGFSTKYRLPANFIRLATVNDEELPETDYKIEQGYLLCNIEAPLNLRYIFDQENITLYGEKLILCIALKIAVYTGYTLTGNRTLVAEHKAAYDDQLTDTKAIDGQNTPPQKVQRSKWKAAKQGFYDPYVNGRIVV